MLTEGHDRDPAWLQALPTDALRLAMKHFLEIAQGLHKLDIRGALSQPMSEKGSTWTSSTKGSECRNVSTITS